MRLRLLACGFLAGLAAAFIPALVGPPGDDAPQTPDPDQMVQLWQTYGTPGKNHEKLKFFVGEWEMTTEIWWQGAGHPPTEGRQTVTNEMIFEGRFLLSRSKGTMQMPIEGKVEEISIEGLWITGYDSFKKKYVVCGVDNGNTAIYTSAGSLDSSGKVYTYFGKMDDWVTGTPDNPFKCIQRIVDDNTVVEEVHDLTSSTKCYESVSRRVVASPDGPSRR